MPCGWCMLFCAGPQRWWDVLPEMEDKHHYTTCKHKSDEVWKCIDMTICRFDLLPICVGHEHSSKIIAGFTGIIEIICFFINVCSVTIKDHDSSSHIPSLDLKTAKIVASASSTLDYCNALLHSLPNIIFTTFSWSKILWQGLVWRNMTISLMQGRN